MSSTSRVITVGPGLAGQDGSHWTRVISYHCYSEHWNPQLHGRQGIIKKTAFLGAAQSTPERTLHVQEMFAPIAILSGEAPSQEPVPRGWGLSQESRKDASNSQIDPQLNTIQRLLQGTSVGEGKEYSLSRLGMGWGVEVGKLRLEL